MFRFVFSGLENRGQLRDLLDFLRLQNLGYPRYMEWVGRAEAELEAGYKQAILAFSEGRLVGNVLYQPHKSLKGLLEIKNVRVHPSVRMRDFGRFMLEQVPAENQGFIGAIGDVRPDQPGLVHFLERCGYVQAGIIPLYDEQKEVLLIKPFQQNLKQVLACVTPIFSLHA